jgi:hypothetical protein
LELVLILLQETSVDVCTHGLPGIICGPRRWLDPIRLPASSFGFTHEKAAVRTDLEEPPRMARKAALNLIERATKSPFAGGYSCDFDPFGDFELIFGASKLSLKAVEIPIRNASRTYGETQISRFHHGFMLLRWCISRSWRIKAM